jgi:[ribosomal protein S18]-alanine N-acetyltransferase
VSVLPVIALANIEEAATIALMSRQYIEQGLGWSWNVSRVEAAIRHASTNVAVIHGTDGEVIGFAIMQYGDSQAHLALLAIHPDHRRRGLAAALLLWLEKCADTAGIGRVSVEARSDNPLAIAFYERQGYVQLARVAGYYRGVLDAVRMEKHLWTPPH